MTFVKEEIATLKEQGIVEDAPSDTTWAVPIVVVKKADGGWRLCTDFRKLISVTEPDPFSLPRIEDLLDKVGKAQFLTYTYIYTYIYIIKNLIKIKYYLNKIYGI